MSTISLKTWVSIAVAVFIALVAVLMTFDSPGLEGLMHFRPSQEWLLAAQEVRAEAEKTCWHPLGVDVNINLTPKSCTGSFLRSMLFFAGPAGVGVIIFLAYLFGRENKPEALKKDL